MSDSTQTEAGCYFRVADKSRDRLAGMKCGDESKMLGRFRPLSLIPTLRVICSTQLLDIGIPIIIYLCALICDNNCSS